ncbi:hypothetical protein ACQ4PT_068518 [Festuca glaucescens]
MVASNRPAGLPVFINCAPQVKDSWSEIPDLTQFPDLDHMAQRIARLTRLKLSGNDLNLSWFKCRIQPLQYHERLICKYVDNNDKLRVTSHNLPSDSLNKRIQTLYKLDALQEDDLAPLIHQPVEDPEKGEDIPEADDEESNKGSGDLCTQDHKTSERHGGGGRKFRQESENFSRQKISAKKDKTKPPQKAIASRTKASPAAASDTPVPPTESAPGTSAPEKSPAQPTPQPAPKKTPSEVIPISSEQRQESMGGNFMGVSADSDKEDVEVNSQNMAEAMAKDAMVIPPETAALGPSVWPKAYQIKLFRKLTEAEKWELQQDLLNEMMKDVWAESDKEFDAIELYKKKSNEFLDKHLKMRKETQCVSLKAEVDALSAGFETLKSIYEKLEKDLEGAHNEKLEAEDKLAEKLKEHGAIVSEKLKEHETIVSEKDGTIKQLKDEVDDLKSELAEANELSDRLNIEIFEGFDPDQLLIACEGYDHRIARNIDHSSFYDKTVLPEDAAEEALLQKEIKPKTSAGTSAQAADKSSSEVSWSDSDKIDASKKNEATKNDSASSPAQGAEK